jgi:hypothetical protein
MKVFVVTTIDTNLVNSVDRIFLCAHDAEKYVSIQEVKYRAMDYFIREYSVAADSVAV